MWLQVGKLMYTHEFTVSSPNLEQLNNSVCSVVGPKRSIPGMCYVRLLWPLWTMRAALGSVGIFLRRRLNVECVLPNGTLLYRQCWSYAEQRPVLARNGGTSPLDQVFHRITWSKTHSDARNSRSISSSWWGTRTATPMEENTYYLVQNLHTPI